ncbi:Alkaline phosphatase synthesis sensor protein PhoR [bioreactor metagenome]|uniref:Alkaline phosphatase synthesis sensor protein PhoR n=1 Tax=bioreactor metagenome TaxID=1076179 RepID=A0A645IS98_9ZZZZ
MYPLNLIDVLNDAIRSIKHIALTKNITINYSSKINQKNMDGDYGRLRQMFLVILDNAIKFSPENQFIDINVDKDKITITDYGAGIHKKDLNHIFERFYKTSDEGNKNGTGLGLAISKEIAERHNLNLSVESSFGNYTSFIIE